MENTKRIQIAKTVGGEKYFADRRKNSMARAVALRTVHELVLTDKWDYLFKGAGIKVDTAAVISWGPVNKAEGYVDAFSIGRLPRLVAEDFIVRIEETNNTLSPDFPDCRNFRFSGINKNDSIKVVVRGKDGLWQPAGVQVFLLADKRTNEKQLVTDFLPI